ncbi:cysteine-S-conjugate beta-lyase [Paragonimus westermani]|uniref:Cysteine-S-conjugate beta-lyase n=1 Tax=Paragonimus westermani TaxID=34504 RepID=A0A5J4NSL6_9TREM|nr:cysteine-S-conjugate beta-lyase [Paragonimus westermani]
MSSIVVSLVRRAMSTDSFTSPIVLASRVRAVKPSIWVEINKAVAKYKPINLGQGFPDCLPRTHVLQSIGSLGAPDVNPLLHQYTRSMGHPRLVNILAKLYTPFMRCDPQLYMSAADPLKQNSFAPDRQLDPMNEVIVSIGAYGALFAAICSLIDQGDEVIIMEPSFDCYAPMTIGAGGVPVYLPLRPQKPIDSTEQITSDDWKWDPQELQSKITKRTKMIILNTPHNPLGKVFDLEELQSIADLCIKHNLVCVSDEVYEWLVFPPKKHIKIASLPGMWPRTLTIGSAGKTFSVTGWKLGWTVGPSNLIHAMQMHQQNTVYTCPTPMQEAVAHSLELELDLLFKPQSYFQEMCAIIEPKGRSMVKRLNQLGMQAIRPTGGYFLFADISKIRVPLDELETDPSVPYDFKFNNWLIQRKVLEAGAPSRVVESLETVEKFVYSGGCVSSGRMFDEVTHRLAAIRMAFANLYYV